MSPSPFPVANVYSYSEIQEFLNTLGPPAAGRKRMFRGQVKGYFDVETGLPKLLPALAREKSDHTYDPAWLVSIQMYSMAFGEHGASTLYDQIYLWGPALLQHYGPGSSYLDVSSDIDIALWFAMYKRQEKWLAVMQPSGMERSHCCSWYTDPKWTDPGIAPVLYVFDAASWSGEGGPAHADLVELTALNVAGNLPDEARRLHQQVASLLYCDIRHPNGPNLGSELVAMMNLTPTFDKSSVPSYGRSVAQVFPSPSADAFYKALLSVPAQLHFEPTRLEHPLAIPCYLDEPPLLPDSPAKGDRHDPQQLSHVEAAKVVGLDTFAALGNAMNPPLMYEYVVSTNPTFGEPMIPTTSDGKQFRLKDATPFFLEGPLWSYLPSCHTEETCGEWIQSALPIGIAPELAGQPTNNVYIEMSTIDALYPQKDLGNFDEEHSAVRGIWMVRSGNRYWCTTYRTGDGGVMSHSVEFRFMPEPGLFIRVAPEKESSMTQAERDNLQPHFDVAEKALFTALLLMRDLSLGFKPPSTFSGYLHANDGTYARMVGEVLEAQLGNIYLPKSAPFLVPRALNGSTYARSSGADSLDRDAWRKSEEGLTALWSAFTHVRDPFYLMEAGAELAELFAQRGNFKEATNVVRSALASMQGMPSSNYSKGFAAILEVLQGRTLFCLDDHAGSMKAFERAMKIQAEAGNNVTLTETQKLVKKLFPASTA